MISELLEIKITKGFFVSAIFDILWMLIYVYFYDYYDRFSFWIPLILIIPCFEFKLDLFIKALVMYYMLNFLLGGVGFILKISGNMFYLLITLSYFLISIGIYLFLVNKKYETYYNVSFYLDKKRCYRAFFDTGCNLSYLNKPVLIISKKEAFPVEYVGTIRINSGIGYQDVPCFYIDDLLVKDKHYQAYGIFLDVEFMAIIGVSFV